MSSQKMSEKPHKRLEVWKKGIDLVVDTYRITEKFPTGEKYAIVDQMRRAAVSVPSNIAEGAARQTRREFINYLHIAQGSLNELDTQCEIATRLGFLTSPENQEIQPRVSEIDRMITGLIRSLRSSLRKT